LDPIRVTKARVAEGLGVRHEMAVRIRVIMVKGGRVRVATGLVVVGPAGLRFSFFPFRIPNPPSMLASYPDGCLAAALSANGAMLGCISSNGMLKVYSMPGAKQIFSTLRARSPSFIRSDSLTSSPSDYQSLADWSAR